jgi:hypothetical protein
MRKLDDIIPPSRRRESEPMQASVPKELGSSEPRRSSFRVFIAMIIVIAGSIAGIFYFSTTEVTVTPATLSVAVEDSFTATHSTGTLPYEIISAEKVASQSVKATGTKEVASFASGTITIYNTQASSQRLIATTRFATPAGLIFRIRTAVTIPGGTTANPGRVKATVYADKAGSSYNVGATKFMVPGLAGTPAGKQVYAESTSPMTGGMSGTIPVVDSALEKETRAVLMKALERDLRASISVQAQAKEGYVIVPGSTSVVYQDLSPVLATDDSAELRVQGTMIAIAFPNVALAKTIANSIVNSEYKNEPLSLSSVESLTLLATPSLPSKDAESFSFTLSGTAPMVYAIDPTRISAAISGKSRLEAKTALENYPEVAQAVITVRPFWRRVVPEDPAEIKVLVESL